MAKLPYDKPTPMWWHEGDERFYKNEGWVKDDYMLVPIGQYKDPAYVKKLEEAVLFFYPESDIESVLAFFEFLNTSEEK